MNEKTKRVMGEQSTGIFQNLSTHFNIPVFQDDIAEDEIPENYNYFLIVYGDITGLEANKTLNQEIVIVYVTENNDQVDEETVDIISHISSVKAVDFERTIKQRLQKKDTDEYIDQVSIIFRRKIPYECKI
nr:hypothetical protein 9 [Bacillaceae bacterium]